MEVISQRRRQHTWLNEHRQILCLITKLYQNKAEDVTAILNSLIAEELRAEGFETGLTVSTVRWQVINMEKGIFPASRDIWRMIVVDMNISQVRTSFRALRDDIEDAALSLGISLQLRAKELDVVKPCHWRRRARDVEGFQGVLGDLVSSEDETESESDKERRNPTTDKRPVVPPNTRGNKQLLSPNSSCSDANAPKTGFGKRRTIDDCGNGIPNVPRLVFRWFGRSHNGLNTPTEIRAGKFLEVNTPIPSPQWDMPAVYNHLAPGTHPSPYISVRDSLLPCLFHALRAKEGEDPCIVVVDLHKVFSLSGKWDDNICHPSPVLVKKFNLKVGKTHSYRGYGEWLIHGRIPQEAIIAAVTVEVLLLQMHQMPFVSNVFQPDKFISAVNHKFLMKDLLKSSPPMKFMTGRAVGSFSNLIGIPLERKEQFSAKIASSWRLGGYKKAKPNKIYEEFMKGVFAAEDNWFGSNLSDDGLRSVVQQQENDDNSDKETEALDSEGIEDIDYMEDSRLSEEQELIDAQLQAELRSTLQDGPSSGWHSASLRTAISSQESRICDTRRQATPQFTRPRSSSLFTFSKPHVSNTPVDWEFVDGRDVSPLQTRSSALDTFTAELLAKAEECSTAGSFSREPSVLRGASEIQATRAILPAQRSEAGGETLNLKDTTMEDDRMVIDLCSDDEEGKDDVGFEVLAWREIGRHD